MFDALIEKYPCMKPFLESNADIVHNADFETGIEKIQESLYGDMSETEKNCYRNIQEW